MAQGDTSTYLKPSGRTVGRGLSSGIEKMIASETFGNVPTHKGFEAGEGLKYGMNVITEAAHQAMKGSSEVLNRILGMKIDNTFTRNDLNYEFMLQLMNINVNERELRITGFGSDANYLGDSNQYTPMVKNLSYTEPNNYVENFAKQVSGLEKGGYITTKSSGDSSRAYPTDVHTDNNLFYDDLDAGSFRNKIVTNDNPDSIITKTKRLFNQRKINTIISRFATGADAGSNDIGYKDDARTSFGMSHGRNLLRYEAETATSSYNNSYNGYNNPYCRVWTHHYQYDQVKKMIRPFIDPASNGGEGADGSVGRELSTLHDWGKRFTSGEDSDYGATEGYWKVKGTAGWDKSVLDSNGFVKIAPKFGKDNGAGKVHPRDCMFSIENLAWRGYSPYEFESALSWEQRGPLGGRIMWFPPYGLSFNESTSVNWQNNTFIGRGEDVYTYTNTTRTGTLSFMMITDHPSVLDYALWNEDDNPVDSKGQPNKLSDTDILRFFAGCDSMNPNDPSSILSHVRPTPMMDEATQGQKVEEEETTKKPKESVQPKPVVEPSSPEAKEKTVEFYVFYPNNYSGYYDRQVGRSENSINPKIEPIEYLLAGDGCNLITEIEGSEPPRSHNTAINFYSGKGYEMGDDPISYGQEDTNAIVGTNSWKSGVKPSVDKYVPVESRKFRYRVDGEYVVPSDVSETYSNTYNQIFTMPESYEDKKSYGMNLNVENIPLQDKTNLYSLGEITFAACLESGKRDDIKDCLQRNRLDGTSPRIKELRSIFKDYQLVGIGGVGFSSNQAFNQKKTVNDERNEYLARERCNTATEWVEKLISDGGIKKDGKNFKKEDTKYEPSAGGDRGDASGINSKFYRSAKVTMKFKMDEATSYGDPVTNISNNLGQAYDETPPAEVVTSDPDKYTVDESRFIKVGQSTSGNKTYDIYKEVTSKGFDNSSAESTYELYATGRLAQMGNEFESDAVDISEMNRNHNAGYWYYDPEDENEKYKKWPPETSDTFLTTVNGKVIELNKNLAWAEKDAKSRYNDSNRLRYDQEYFFYRRIQETDSPIYHKITEKLKHFDPAYHSMTPEGFNERLNFLNQCTRQGNTKTMSDLSGKTATNLAFGRPPFCVLRLGDFYYQTIVIDSMTVDYSVSNGVQWDLNPEGAGVQPMFAQVTLNFKFIGGGDLGGPIRRLQNAMTFNYYANTRLYDNRADRITYNTSGDKVGGDDYGINTESSYAHIVDLKSK